MRPFTLVTVEFGRFIKGLAELTLNHTDSEVPYSLSSTSTPPAVQNQSDFKVTAHTSTTLLMSSVMEKTSDPLVAEQCQGPPTLTSHKRLENGYMIKHH